MIGAGTMAINNSVLTGGGTVHCEQGECSGSGTIRGDLINPGRTISPGNGREFMAVPEPTTWFLLSLGLIAVLGSGQSPII